MRESDLSYLVCPACHEDLSIGSVGEREEEKLITAELRCTSCQVNYPVIRGVPRFVPRENYASSFGLEWTIHARTQYDSYTGLPLSEKRFFEETKWQKDLAGEEVLEVGCGSGRFTEQAAATGAFVISFDYSYAIEANYQINGNKKNVFVVQADLYQMPFRLSFFDKAFCFGVLQHTPDVHRAFLCLPPMLKSNGRLAVDVYKKSIFSTILHTKYILRLITRHMSPESLYRFTKGWTDLMWPLATMFRKIPRLGISINWRLMVADYSSWGLKGNLLKEWAYLDGFDMLAPRYDSPQTLKTMRHWFEEAQLTDIEVGYGYNGIEGRGRKP